VILMRMRSKLLYGLVLVMVGMPLLAVGLLTENPLTSQRLLIAVVWLPAIQALGLVWVWRFLEEQLPGSCQFSPVMGPLVFGQSGPLPEVTIGKLLTNNEQTIGICQGHGVDSMGTSFPGS
jgi:hypothetical protein